MNNPNDGSSTAPPATAPVPDHFDVISALLDIKGAIKLCQRAASNDTSGSESIQSIDNTLTLALGAIERLYATVDTDTMRDAWLHFQCWEVAHGR